MEWLSFKKSTNCVKLKILSKSSWTLFPWNTHFLFSAKSDIYGEFILLSIFSFSSNILNVKLNARNILCSETRFTLLIIFYIVQISKLICKFFWKITDYISGQCYKYIYMTFWRGNGIVALTQRDTSHRGIYVFNIISPISYYLPLWLFIWKKSEFPLPKEAFCHVWLKLAL